MKPPPNVYQLKPQAKPPILNVPWVVLAVVALLLLVHFGLWVLGPDWQTFATYALAFIPDRLAPNSQIPALPGGQYWSALTYSLLHADWMHVGMNALWMLIFSTPVARRMGWWRYLVVVALAAIGGAAAMMFRMGEGIIVVGASGAVSGAMAAAVPIMFSPDFRKDGDLSRMAILSPTDILRQRQALVFTLIFIVLTLFSGASQVMTNTAFLEERPIAWEAHAGGFFVGLIVFYILEWLSGSRPEARVLH